MITLICPHCRKQITGRHLGPPPQHPECYWKNRAQELQLLVLTLKEENTKLSLEAARSFVNTRNNNYVRSQ